MTSPMESDTEVRPRKKLRSFSAETKARLLAEYDAATTPLIHHPAGHDPARAERRQHVDSFQVQHFDRKMFLASLGLLGLAGCGGAVLMPNQGGVSTQNLCAENCTGVGGFAETGGVNRAAWTNFSRISLPSAIGGTLTRGWNDGSVVAHGVNNASGQLAYTGVTTLSANGSGLASITQNLTITNGPQLSGTVQLPTVIPSEGNYSLTLGGMAATCTVDATNNKMAFNYSVEGYPTELVITQTDSSGQTFNAQVTQNGKT